MIKTKLINLISNKGFKRYFLNTSWLFGERILGLLFGLTVGVLVARYLGPEKYGIFSYALSLVSLFAIATHMGLVGLVVRELVKEPEESGIIMGTTFLLKLIAAFLSFAAISFFAIISENVFNVEFWLLIIVSITIFFQPFNVFDFWFQSRVQVRYSSISRSVGIIMASLLKVIFILTGAHLLAFGFAYVLQITIGALLLLYFYNLKSYVNIDSWKFSGQKAKKLLSQGWMIMLASIFATIYLKIDKVMLRWIVDSHEVGIYSVAAKISEIWYFIPVAIVTSVFPKLIQLKKQDPDEFNNRLQQLFDFLFILALAVALIVLVFSDLIINFLYGADFSRASIVLTIHIWAGLFIFMRAALSKWILIEDALKYSLITQGLGAITNVLLNAILISHYKANGAAIATLISYAMASYFSLLFYKKTRPLFWMMSKSIIAIIRLPFKII